MTPVRLAPAALRSRVKHSTTEPLRSLFFFFFFFSGRLREVLLYFLPVPNLFLANDILYPCPTSSNSTPESVAPSDINCIAVVDGLERPFATVNLARIDP